MGIEWAVAIPGMEWYFIYIKLPLSFGGCHTRMLTMLIWALEFHDCDCCIVNMSKCVAIVPTSTESHCSDRLEP